MFNGLYCSSGQAALSPDHKIRTLDDLTPLKLRPIAEEVGRDWKMLGRYLGLKETEIQAIDHANPRNLHEASFEVFTRYDSMYVIRICETCFLIILGGKCLETKPLPNNSGLLLQI